MARKLLWIAALAIALSGCAGAGSLRTAAQSLRQPCPGIAYWGVYWSPDGNKLALLLYLRGQEPQMALMNPDGSGFTSLAAAIPGAKADLRWSPDSRQIAFTSRYPNNIEVYTVNVADGTTRQLTHRPQNDVLPTWSADGKQLAYVSLDGRADPGNRIYVIGEDGRGEKLLHAGSGLVNALAWSPDGRRIAYSEGTGNGAIYTISPDGGQPTRVTDGSGDDRALAWSPDSRRIALMSYRGQENGLYAINVDGSGFRRLTANVDGEAMSVWADAQHVAYLTARPENHLVLIDVDSLEATELTRVMVDGYFNPPTWSPDGSQVALVAYSHINPAMASMEVFVMSRSGGRMAQITDNPGKYTCLSWPF